MENEIELEQECKIFSRCAALKQSGLLFGPEKNCSEYYTG